MSNLPTPIATEPASQTPKRTASSDDKLSPAMRQYQQFKTQHPGYVLFFRMGDFYEMFWEDAKLASKVLGVALTSRSRGGLAPKTPFRWRACRFIPWRAICGR